MNPIIKPVLTVLAGGAELLAEAGEYIVKRGQGTFEEYINKRTEELDSYIINQENYWEATYVAGEVHLLAQDTNEFYLLAEFYFRDKNGEYLKKTIKGKPLPMNLCFLPEAQDTLRFQEKVSFEYERPE